MSAVAAPPTRPSPVVASRKALKTTRKRWQRSVSIDRTMADLLRRLGDVDPERVWLSPAPGQASEADVERILDTSDHLPELIDGTLVEKPEGFYEARLAALISYRIEQFLELHDLGITIGADGPVRLRGHNVRIPDTAFYSWRHFPERGLPSGGVLHLPPDLVVEVLSPSNTAAEMERKVRDYFETGVRLVWIIDPPTMTAQMLRSPDEAVEVPPDGSLNGGDVLPGFSLSLRELFAKAGTRRS